MEKLTNTSLREYEKVPCSTCGAAVGVPCTSRKTQKLLSESPGWNRRDFNYAHSQRMKDYKNGVTPFVHTAWPVGRSPA